MKNRCILFLVSALFPAVLLNSQISFTITPTICKNDTNYLSANTGSLTNCTFTWACSPSGASFSSPNNSVTAVSFTNAGTYTIMLTVTSGTIVDSFQASVTAFPLPTITLAQNNYTSCITSNFPLFSKPVHLTAAGGSSYTWNPNPPATGNPNGAVNDVRPTTTTCFSVTGMDANGCKAMAITCIAVIPRFTINIAPINTLICNSLQAGIDNVVNLTANNPSSPVFGLSSSHSYSWTGTLGTMLTSPFSSVIAVSPMSTSTFTAEMRDSLSCISLPAMAAVSVQNCTDILENSIIDKQIAIYPNPTKNRLSVELSNPEGTKLDLYSSLGQIVFSSNINTAKQEIDLTNLSNGVYILKVKGISHQSTFKIIKE